MRERFDGKIRARIVPEESPFVFDGADEVLERGDRHVNISWGR